jgi:hypothetical protein
MAEEEEDIREATAGHTVEATDRLTTAVILETSKLLITTVSTSNLQTCRAVLADVGCRPKTQSSPSAAIIIKSVTKAATRTI